MEKKLRANDYTWFVGRASCIMDTGKLGSDEKYAEMCIAALDAENEVLRLRGIIRNGGVQVEASCKKISDVAAKRDCVRISMTPKMTMP